jgi:hypothetical protein
VPLLRLVEANTKLTTNRSAVATTTVRRPRESKRLDARRTASSTSCRPVLCVSAVT